MSSDSTCALAMRLPPQIHNGNLTNAEELRATLQRQSELSYQRHLRTDSDSEVLLNIFADEIHRAHKVSGGAAARLRPARVVTSCPLPIGAPPGEGAAAGV